MVHIIAYHSGEPRLLIPEEVDEEDLKGQTTPEVIANLVELIGGFNKWKELNADCRMNVTKHLDIEALSSLGACSWEDRDFVDATKIHVTSVEIHDCYDELSNFPRRTFKNEVLVNIQFHAESYKEHHILFSQNGEDTLVKTATEEVQISFLPSRDKVRTVLKNTNHIMEAVTFAEKWIKRGKFELERLVINLRKYPQEGTLIESLPKCKELQLNTNDHAVFSWWLHRVPRKMERLCVMRYRKKEKSYGKLDPEVATFTTSSMVYEAADFNYVQFLEHWSCGHGLIPEHFEILKVITRDQRQNNHLVGDNVVPWLSEQFDNEPGAKKIVNLFEAKKFFYRFECYQVYSFCNPWDSLSVCIAGHEVYIMRTGRKAIVNGKEQKEYYIPRDLQWIFRGDAYYQ